MNKRLSPPQIPKIGKLLYRNFIVNDNPKYRFLKKLKLVKVSNIHIKNSHWISSKKAQIVSSVLLKYKPYKTLNFESCIGKEIPIKKQICLVKNNMRIKRLITPLGKIYQTLNLRPVNIWLKYARYLKELYCRNSEKISDISRFQILPHESRKFWKQLKKLKLEVLDIYSDNLNGENEIFSLRLKRLPNTIKKLSLKYAPTNTRLIKTSSQITLNSLRNLKSLSLGFPLNGEILKKMLETIPNVNQLVSLCLDDPYPLDKKIPLPILPLQENNQLKTLSLRLEDSPKDIGNFIKIFENCKLKTFKVSISNLSIAQRKDWSWILDVINHQTTLQKIKIEIGFISDDPEKEDRFYKAVIKTISKLKDLKKLKLEFVDNAINVSGNEISIKELHKLKNLEEISFTSNFLKGNIWDDLIELAQKFSSTLKKLKLNFGGTTHNNNYIKELKEFLKGLSVIEVLKFGEFDIPSDKFWKDLVESLTALKSLRKIRIGYFYDQEIIFKQGIKEIMSMPHFEEFSYTWIYYTYHKLDRRKEVRSLKTIDWSDKKSLKLY